METNGDETANCIDQLTIREYEIAKYTGQISKYADQIATNKDEIVKFADPIAKNEDEIAIAKT